MCYLIATDINKSGCIAWQTKHGMELSQFVSDLENKLLHKTSVQIVVINKPEFYGEYSPYRYIKDKKIFEEMVMTM